MKFLIVFVLTFALASSELKSRNVVLPAGRSEGRISRGQNAHVGQFPYMVQLRHKRANGTYLFCCGSVLNNNWVLTAAHCTYKKTEIDVMLGATNSEYPQKIHRKISSKDIIIHPEYEPKFLENDISLIKIPFTRYTPLIQPVELPPIRTTYPSYVGYSVIISGWGKMFDYNPGVVQNLQFARKTIVPNDECRLEFPEFALNTTICLRTKDDGVSACHGDSGSPMVLEYTNLQIGVFSYLSKSGCQNSYPVGYTRITSYLGWIKDNTGIYY